MYSERNEKEYNEDIELIKFLKDGEFEINCDIITQFNAYS
jgi:predicted  nucleic acid-binding Zn-ribbon protein